MNIETITLYRPVGSSELELIKRNKFRKWPARLPEQSIFYPVTNIKYAKEITEKWNKKNDREGYITRFKVKREFMSRYEIHKVGASHHHTEWWIPAEDLDELNDNIIGLIEVID